MSFESDPKKVETKNPEVPTPVEIDEGRVESKRRENENEVALDALKSEAPIIDGDWYVPTAIGRIKKIFGRR